MQAAIRLIRPDPDLLDAALARDAALAESLGHPVVAGWATFTDALRRERDALGGARWGARFF